MNSRWFETFKGTPEQKESLRQSIQNSSYILNILTEIIEKEIQRLELNKFEDYSNANWALATADKNGQLRAYKTLLQLTKKDNT